MPLTIEELDDLSEVHVVLQDDVAVMLHECQGDEENKVAGGDGPGCPDGLPCREHVVIHHFWRGQEKG